MKPGFQIVLGILSGLLFSLMVLGGLATALMESAEPLSLLNTPSPTWTRVSTQLPGLPTFTPSPTMLPSPSATLQPPTSCPPPAGWAAVTVLAGDSVVSLAERYGTTVEAVQAGNCLVVSSLTPGSVIYLPPLPPTATTTSSATAQPRPATATTRPCGAPTGWVQYRVQVGDTLYALSRVLGVSVAQLQQANCLGLSTTIRAGSYLWVPFLPPTRTPAATTAIPATAAPPTQEPPTRTTIPSPSFTAIPPTVTALPPSDTPVTPEATAIPPTEPVPSPADTTTPPVGAAAPAVSRSGRAKIATLSTLTLMPASLTRLVLGVPVAFPVGEPGRRPPMLSGRD